MSDTKKIFGKIKLLVILLLFSLLPFFLWFYVTQPINVDKTDHRSLMLSQALKAHVIALSVTMAPRDYLHPQNTKKVALYIKKEFAKTNAKVTLQDNPNVNDYFRSANIRIGLHDKSKASDYYKNIVAEFGPDTRERIIIGAHYDAFKGSPGADDNATGVAALIEIAKLLSKEQLKIKVELVAYCLEEPPFFSTKAMGSYAHASTTKNSGSKVKVMISLEMLGYYDNKSASQSYPLGFLKYFYSDQGNFISVIGKFGQTRITRKIKRLVSANTSLPVYSINAPTLLVGVDFSDHRSYWDHGFPAVMITDTAFYRNKHYHLSTDTYDKIDYQRMSSVVAAIYMAVKKMANES